MKDPPPIEIEQREVEELIEKAQRGALDAAEQRRLVPLLWTLLWIERTLLSTRISLSRLKRILFGKKTEKHPRKPQDPETAEEEGGNGAAGNPEQGSGGEDPPSGRGESSSARPADGQPSDSPPHNRRGHGRRAAADYPGAETIFCPHEEYRSGDRCPKCGRGRLYPWRPLVRLRFTAQPLALVRRFALEPLRCNTCGALWVAPLPPEAGGETYDPSLKVILAVVHYHLGLPFKRIESFQEMLGMPLPDATQWALVEQVADSAYPVYESLKKLGANQPLVYQDDTGARILSLIRENQAEPPPERKGMYTTVLRFEGEHSICLYFTGRQHAGENLDDILAHRDPRLAPIQWMSDALAANTYVGDVLTSLIETCRLAGANPLDYLGALMANRSAPPPLGHPPPVLGPLDRLGVGVPQ